MMVMVPGLGPLRPEPELLCLVLPSWLVSLSVRVRSGLWIKEDNSHWISVSSMALNAGCTLNVYKKVTFMEGIYFKILAVFWTYQRK